MAVLALQAFQDLLGPLDPDVAALLESSVFRERYPPGHAVFREGGVPRHLYLLMSGQIRLARTAPLGNQVVVSYVRPPALFGHVAILGRVGHLTTATAMEPSECAQIPARFLLAREDGPPRRLAIRLLEMAILGMNHQLRAVNARLLSLSNASQAMDEVAEALSSYSLLQDVPRDPQP